MNKRRAYVDKQADIIDAFNTASMYLDDFMLVRFDYLFPINNISAIKRWVFLG